MMLRLVLNLPTASLRDAKMGDILACFPCRSRIFPLIGRNCGQRLKTGELRGRGEDGPDLHCPKTGAVNLKSVNCGSVALVRIDLGQVFGNGENTGFAFELDPVGGIRGNFYLPRFHTETGHNISNRAALA